VKFFTSGEKRILWFLTAIMLIGLLVKVGRNYFNQSTTNDVVARDAAQKSFREGNEKYLASSDSQSAALWMLGLTQRVDLNHASVEALQVLPGIGPVLAKKIVVYREKNGYFHTIDDLAKVKGIGPKLIKRWEGLIVVLPD
jgi:competence protein ComEA